MLIKLPLFSVSANAIKPDLGHIITVKWWEQVIQSGGTDEVFVQAHEVTLLGVGEEQVHVKDVFRLNADVGWDQVD